MKAVMKTAAEKLKESLVAAIDLEGDDYGPYLKQVGINQFHVAVAGVVGAGVVVVGGGVVICLSRLISGF